MSYFELEQKTFDILTYEQISLGYKAIIPKDFLRLTDTAFSLDHVGKAWKQTSICHTRKGYMSH